MAEYLEEWHHVWKTELRLAIASETPVLLNLQQQK